jgi:hypothetical protein
MQFGFEAIIASLHAARWRPSGLPPRIAKIGQTGETR